MAKLAGMESTVRSIELPYVRREVLHALRALGDVAHQESNWMGQKNQQPYDDLTSNVHILYDDSEVLPEPHLRVGTVLFAEDVEPLVRLSAVFTPLLDKIGNRPDAEYIADPAWSGVAEAAHAAFESLTLRGS
jgi:hypothetical protein